MFWIKRFAFVLLACLSLSVCGDDKSANIKKINSTLLPASDEHEVFYKSFTKDGARYFQYDFGRAIFTLESEYANNNDEKTLEMRWYWPDLLPSKKITDVHDVKQKGRVRTRIDFTGVGQYRDGLASFNLWQKTNCLHPIDSEKYKRWCYQEVDSEYPEFKKFKLGLGDRDKIYIARTENALTPQGTPIVFTCVPSLSDSKMQDCGFNFQYYGQVSVAVSFRSDALPEWKDLTTRMDSFLKARFQEKK